MSPPTVQAVVELVGLGKHLRFQVDSSADQTTFPNGKAFESPGHLWHTTFVGRNKKVKMDFKDGRIFFIGEFALKGAGGGGKFWRPSR